MTVCTICDKPIQDGEQRRRVARSRDGFGPRPAIYTHKDCRAKPVDVPFIASWSAELTPDPFVIVRGLVSGIRYADERGTDRDDRGVLWSRRANARGTGRPLHGLVHPGRQRLAMDRLLCQVCGEPADRDDRGVLWLVEDDRGLWDGWPDGLLTTHPPTCRVCIRAAREQCPHMWKGSVLVRVGSSDVCAVYGRRYTATGTGAMVAAAEIVPFDSPMLRWMVAAQLVRELSDCRIVSADEELAVLP
ncbi:hypothetical protein [Streptomyces longwoodensis]|uniref:hypothetical protein n=1 Tax=Streptomyces longwoodensis TaxID=68231 RepID=UPI00325157D3